MKVIIIGAGIAGLSAAAHLIENGIKDVTIIEAQSKHGGRVLTKAFGDNIVELGGNWIHGTALTNSMMVLACQNELLNVQAPTNFKWGDRFCYTPDGKAIDRTTSDEAFSMFNKIRSEMDEVALNKLPRDINNVADYIDYRVAEELRNVDVPKRGEMKSVINTFTNFERMSTACDLRQASVQFYGSYGSIPGLGRLYIPSGVSSLVDCIKKNVPSEVITYNTLVSKVHIDTKKPALAVKVSCEAIGAPSHAEVEYDADHVIVTASLGYLKAHHSTLFKPALPREKIAAIEKIGYTGVEKLFIYYEKPFWEVGSGGPLLCWPDESYLSRTPEQWFMGMIGFAEYPLNNRVLFAWVPLPDGKYMNSLDDREIKTTCAKLFRMFLNNPTIPEPDQVCRSSWCSNPYTLGTYSYSSTTSSPTDVQTLAGPLLNDRKKPIVLFAGEATAMPCYSTMHGARSSGLREAERIISFYKQSKL